MPSVLMMYAIQDHKGINIGRTIPIRFSDGHEVNIEKLEKISSQDDFYKWCADTDFQNQLLNATWKYNRAIEEF